jgi:4-hydroxythreonine-4-phosphate dehydrogenase
VTAAAIGAEAADRAGGLVLTGGATARAVLAALGVDLIRLAGAPAPGLAAGLAGELPVVLKAGGFGSPRTLLEAMRRLRR